ncbi:hypothetical protein GIB67_032362 [Kingdonia uniflora]|uniref:non-specific serine/threonine protein kinase n=1 Tax=Kingdonia uniflora TaxID=39325 RepID=A0A7J7MIX9_9MAGN|nr:hypothetical protein GIB67_032362 [Kingdonia uniflora]
MLEQKLADADVSEEDQSNLLKFLEKKETEYMRLQRHKMGADDFELLTMIGKGAFGEVRVCREKTTGHVYAMKKLKKSEMLRRGQVEHVKAERNLLAEVDSNCIVKLYCSFQDDEFLYLIMEYLPGGDMMTLLMRKDTLTEDEARFYVGETVLAIASIHKHNYIHRDIKPDNLLLDKYGHMKLSDFGLCKPLDCRNLHEKDFSAGHHSNGSQSDEGHVPRRTQQEQLQHWQRNRRMLMLGVSLAMSNPRFASYVCAILEIARLEAGVVTDELKKFDRNGLEMKHHEETTKREVHRAIDLVGGKDRDVLESSLSKSHEEVRY